MPKQSGPEVKFLWTAGLTYGFFPVFYVDTGKFSLQNTSVHDHTSHKSFDGCYQRTPRQL